MADPEPVPEDLDDLLDSALDDFRVVDGSTAKRVPSGKNIVSQWGSSPTTSGSKGATQGRGLGSGLPALMPGKKKSTGKAVNSSKSISVASHVVPTKSGSPSENSLSATLERLAEQTRQTVGNIDAAPEGNIAGDEMENLVRQFEELGGSQDMHSIMDTMMRQLLSEEVLHEPMKEIGERYPQWLESHESQLSKEDFVRYSRQHEFIKQLCHVYETTPNDFQKVVDLMQNMQDCGQPPPDIVRELAPGLELGEDGLPMLPDFSALGASGTPANCSIM